MAKPSTRIIFLLILFLLIPTIVFAQYTIPTSGLVSWWRANGNANDSFGSYNGSLINGATFAPGMIDQAFSLDGTNDYVYMPNTTLIDGGSQATYMAWVYPAALPADGFYFNIINVGEGTMPTWDPLQCRLQYYRLGGQPVRFYMDCGINNANDVSYRYSSNTYSPNSWYLVVAVFNNGTIDMYVNGVLDNGTQQSTAGAFINTNAFNYVTIGALRRSDGSLTSSYWPGLIDEVAIYNRALSANEIEAIYNSNINSNIKEIPTMTEWGMIIFIALAGLGSIYFLRRKGRIEI